MPQSFLRHAALALLLACGLSAPASAACLSCTCSVSATGLRFGHFDPVSPTPTSSTSQLRLSCWTTRSPELVTYEVALSHGLSGSFATRLMLGAGDQLAYNLYTDSAHTTIWGDGTGGSTTLSGSMTATRRRQRTDLTVYGQIPPQQIVRAGNYADTIVVTINY
ncbi:MAG: spore coat protein U domain-containing protein [Alphaproteobacteria bacterium]|nr:spore coat protein U domain-containing protein [Alphaproteobacteria bacterium]